MTEWCTCNKLKEAEEKAAKWDAIVMCGECKFSSPSEMRMDGSWNIGNCSHPRFRGSIHRCNVCSTDTCSWGERRDA